METKKRKHRFSLFMFLLTSLFIYKEQFVGEIDNNYYKYNIYILCRLYI